MEPKRFYRSDTDHVIAGVCGGVAEYFNIDPLLIRLLFVVLLFAGGSGFLIYIILWIAAPKKTELQQKSNPEATGNMQSAQEPQKTVYETSPQKNPLSPEKKQAKQRKGLIGGLVLITLGLLFLVDEFIPSLDFGDLWPFLLVVIGVGLLINSIAQRKENR
jgi:phage shock protein C